MKMTLGQTIGYLGMLLGAAYLGAVLVNLTGWAQMLGTILCGASFFGLVTLGWETWRHNRGAK